MMSNRLGALPPIYDERMSRAFAKAEAAFGKGKVKRYTIGDPPLKSPEFIEVYSTLVGRTEGHGYTIPAWGSNHFLTSIARYREEVEGVKLDPGKQICGVRRSRLGLTLAVMAWTNPGEVILVPNLRYPGGFHAAVNNCCEVVEYDAGPEVTDPYAVIEAKVDEVTAAGKKVKLIMVINPGNPFGNVLEKDFYPQIIQLADRRGILLLFDEAYLQNVYQGVRAYSLLEFEGGDNVGVCVRTFSKLRNMPDIGAAFIDGNNIMISAAKRLVASLDYALPEYIQNLVCFMLEPRFDEFPKPSNELYETDDMILRTTLSRYNVNVWRNRGSMFGAIELPPHWQKVGSREAAALILEQTGAQVNAGIAHGPGGKNILRFAYTRTPDETQEGANLIGDFMHSFEPESALVSTETEETVALRVRA